MDYFSGLAADLASKRCEKLQSVSYLNLAISVVILLGILVSYLPQHHRIISRATSEGISPYFVLLGTTSSTSAFANILVQPASRADVACCKTVSAFECAAGLLGIAQVGVQWFCFWVILLLFLIFFPREPALPYNTDVKQHTWRTAVSVAITCVIHLLIVLVVSSVLVLGHPDRLGLWANILGVMGSILAGTQYLPQIWMTYHLRHVGSLSIPTMLIQAPGSFVWAGSLAARLGWEGWSTWSILLFTGMLQVCLLSMGIYFEVKARQSKLGDGSDSASVIGGEATDRTPLLNGSRDEPARGRTPDRS
ncbi:hypothetical protein F5884DRAFT_794317 [Xylogone sp. PMI_703]|nr:hypothetical protein F5884DRAFT_794317 [Xylogone sp. PMI_703]